MKKTFLNKLWLVFSAITLSVYSIVYACGGGDDWGWFFDSNFAPETFVDASYTPLFLSTDVFYERGFDTEHSMRFNDEIVSDWSLYLKGSVNPDQVKFFLIDSSAVDVKELFTFFSSKKTNKSVQKWSSKLKLNDQKTKDFITFLHYAKAIEVASVTYDYWSYDKLNTVIPIDAKWVLALEKKHNTSTDSFLKNRYWFQLMKAYFYIDDQKSAFSFFEKTKDVVPKNTLYYRSLSYLAGMNYRNKNYAESNYLYSQVFDHCPRLRIVSAYCFHPQEQLDWTESLKMAKNNQEKAALWAIQGYYGDEEKAIETIYNLKPDSEHLGFLLTRLINNQENKIDKSFKNSTVAQFKKRTQDSVSPSALNLVVKIAKSGKTKQPHLWHLAAGYLETLNGNFNNASSNFDKAEKTMPKTKLAVSQLRLLRFVTNLSKIEVITDKNYNTILSDLKWLYFELDKEKIEYLRYQNAREWSRNYLSTVFKSQKNAIMAELFLKNDTFYDSPANVTEMKTFLLKKNKSPLEEVAVKHYDYNLMDINAYEAVVCTYDDKIVQALNVMKQSGEIQNSVFLGNPFNGSVKDCHDCDHEAYQKKKYTLLDFLNTMKIMQDNINSKQDVYTNALLVANGFYNITHYGNARLFYESEIVGFGSSPYFFRDKVKAMITNCNQAKKYYQIAFTAAKTQEQKAKCQYMLAKCERNEFYNQKYNANSNWWQVESDNVNFKAWDGFQKLKKEYANTQYYKDVIAECGFFNTYVNQ